MIGTTLGHYRIVRQLGSGGMGEVYVAEDTTLSRQVALKVLPQSTAGDPERRQRFEREAKAVAALNHPNIVTIHSVESAGDVLFLTMELVDGRTLAELVPERGLPIDQILKLAIPLTDAVSAAHQRGITHRDLKPTNIMVTGDGRVKVLDFGLAKLAEEGPAGGTGTMLPTEVLTGEGRIVGTVAYMSPEQAEGKPIDPRSDIFSLGIILYEMATGQRPFKGETSVSIISSIMKDTPASISDLNAGLPRDLARIVKRSLVKDPEHRYQTAKDLRNELEALKEDLTSGVVEAPSVSRAPAMPQRSGMTLWIGIVAAGVVVLAAAAALYVNGRRSQKAAEPARGLDDFKLTRLTTTGKATLAAISPDGRYVVHVVNDGGQSLWMRQVATTSNVQIVPPAEVRYDGLAFAPDGNYVYYSAYPSTAGTGGSNIASLYQVPVLGGPARRILEDIDSPVTFSPDGKRLAYLRGFQTAGEAAIMVANIDGTGATRLATRKSPETFPLSTVSWSPDGSVIAATVMRVSGAQRSMSVVAIDASSGNETAVGSKQWDQIGSVAWLGNRGLVITAFEPSKPPTQLWYLTYPAGDARRITNDLNNYDQLSVSADASALVTVQGDAVSHVWITDADSRSPSEITSGTGRFDSGVSWTPDGKIVYHSNASGNLDIWICDADGRNARQLTVDPGFDNEPAVTPDGKYIVFQSSRGGQQIWRMDLDGGNQTQLTQGPGNVLPVVSPDSQWVFYVSVGESQRGIWKMPIGGGDPIRLMPPAPADTDPARATIRATFVPRAISPDGKLFAGSFLDRRARGFRMGIVSIETGEMIKSFDHLFSMMAWTRDGRALTYPEVKDRTWNLWNQPVDGGPPKPVTSFTSDQIFSFAWSRDGKRLAIARGTVTNDVVLVSNLPRR